MIADPDTFKNAISKRDKDGRLYDPRKGLGGYYRYGPRKLVPHLYPESKKQEDDEVDVGRAKIHESVFRRIENHAHAYAPVGLPPFYDVSSRMTARSCSTIDHARTNIGFETSAARRRARARRRSMSGTRSGSGASSISPPSAPRSGWWCFRWSAARNASDEYYKPDPLGVRSRPLRRRVPAELRIDLDRRLCTRAVLVRCSWSAWSRA